jgi:hypothetical protein
MTHAATLCGGAKNGASDISSGKITVSSSRSSLLRDIVVILNGRADGRLKRLGVPLIKKHLRQHFLLRMAAADITEGEGCQPV